MDGNATIDMVSTIHRTQGLLAAEMDGEVVLLNVERGNYYGLDDIASDIWNRLEQPATIRHLCAALSADYDADPATIEDDVRRWAEEMHKNGLIEIAA